MCPTFFEIFRFFYAITHVFPRKTLLLPHEIIKSNIMQKIMKAIAAIMLTAALIGATGCTKPDDQNNVDGTYNGHDYVDLGLPSGTLWATCNVGSDTPENYYDYFSWGETEPKKIYNWNTYKYCEGEYDQLTKYCSKANFGYNNFVDTLTILQIADDAATACWGSGWRTPTKEQWQELIDCSTYAWVTQKGVKGMLFTANNGHSIFLPSYEGYGKYWSKSLLIGYPFRAWALTFGHRSGSDFCYMYDDNRCDGQAVRPVCKN